MLPQKISGRYKIEGDLARSVDDIYIYNIENRLKITNQCAYFSYVLVGHAITLAQHEYVPDMPDI